MLRDETNSDNHVCFDYSEGEYDYCGGIRINCYSSAYNISMTTGVYSPNSNFHEIITFNVGNLE